MPIAIPQDAPMAARRTLGSLVPHPANIGKIMGAKTGIMAPRLKLAGGGIADAENISNNMFSPINAASGVPNADVNFITSPQMGIGKGPPQAPSSKPPTEPSGLQQLTQVGAAANTLGSAYNAGRSLWNGSTMSGADAAAYNAENGLTAADADFASAGDTFGGIGSALSTAADAFSAADTGGGIGAFVSTLFDLLAKGGAVKGRADGGKIPHRDGGGDVSGLTNMLMRREAGETYHPGGLLNSAGPGRTDTINTNVPTGAYVIPADIVSGVGEGNTVAGSAIIDRMFSSQPHGVQARPIRKGEGPPRPPSSAPKSPPTGEQPGSTVNTSAINSEGAYAKGGNIQDKAPVILAGGEYCLSPQQIINKFGSLKRGHKILDEWTVQMRQKIAKEMMALPPPVGSRVKKK